jgi:hypothetical protein
MKQRYRLGLFILALAWSVQTRAVTDAQYQSIRALGLLNGVALPCHYLEQTRRMKKAIVATLPKRRALGDAFDQATNEAFLTFVEEKHACPAPEEFGRQVDAAIGALQRAFPAK